MSESVGAALDAEMSEADLEAFARLLAPQLVAGDCITLSGDLGAGKTTFARALVRAIVGDPRHEVPSPTFALRQDYDSPRGPVVHLDLYRISDARELDELGIGESADKAVLIVEWPERAAGDLPADRFEIRLTENARVDRRSVAFAGLGAAERRARACADAWRQRA